MLEQDKIKRARAEYARKYRQAHPEKIKEAQERYWLRKAEQMQKGGMKNAADNTDSD